MRKPEHTAGRLDLLKDYRKREVIQGIARRIAARAGDRPIQLMEVCGGHTQSCLRYGLPSLLPPNVRLLSGPGCPVCVTPVSVVEKAVAAARSPRTRVATFGDLIRVPGLSGSLETARSEGRTVDMIYSFTDALDIARAHPEETVVLIGIGFETTAPTSAATLLRARGEGVGNLLFLPAHKTMPAAMAWLATSGEVRIDGFICPGHVSTIAGAGMYEFLASEHGKACVISGFEPADLMQSILMLVEQIVEGSPRVEIAYRRGVRYEGNRQAQALLDRVFEPSASYWRGLGSIPGSGLALREGFADLDCERRLDLPVPDGVDGMAPAGCICGAVLRGTAVPHDCGLFGTVCTPESPVGACMVGEEGACHINYVYGRVR